MKKKNLIIVGSIILVIIITLVIVLVILENINKTQKDYIDEAKEYFKDTSYTETSIWALLENGYLKETEEDKCAIIEIDANDVKISGNDCSKAEEYAKQPIVKITTSNDFKINSWNKNETTLSYSLKNNGNSYYNKDDVTGVIWINHETDGREKADTLTVSKVNTNVTYTLQIVFKNGENVLTQDFDILIDLDAPSLVDNFINPNQLFANYEDFSGVDKIYYALTESKREPQKEEFKDQNNLDMECDKTYYAWSYAKDLAGNESSIDYLGDYTLECQKVTFSSDGNGVK